jgi:hypothetical protein
MKHDIPKAGPPLDWVERRRSPNAHYWRAVALIAAAVGLVVVTLAVAP